MNKNKPGFSTPTGSQNNKSPTISNQKTQGRYPNNPSFGNANHFLPHDSSQKPRNSTEDLHREKYRGSENNYNYQDRGSNRNKTPGEERQPDIRYLKTEEGRELDFKKNKPRTLTEASEARDYKHILLDIENTIQDMKGIGKSTSRKHERNLDTSFDSPLRGENTRRNNPTTRRGVVNTSDTYISDISQAFLPNNNSKMFTSENSLYQIDDFLPNQPMLRLDSNTNKQQQQHPLGLNLQLDKVATPSQGKDYGKNKNSKVFDIANKMNAIIEMDTNSLGDTRKVIDSERTDYLLKSRKLDCHQL